MCNSEPALTGTPSWRVFSLYFSFDSYSYLPYNTYMQPIFQLTLRADLPIGNPWFRDRTSVEAWNRMDYDEKCKDATYVANDPRVVAEGTRRNIFAHLYTMYNGKCHWCNIDVILPKVTKQPRNRGTIDHLKTMRMGRKNYYDGGHVLACRGCNGDRNTIECRDYKKRKPGTIHLSF